MKKLLPIFIILCLLASCISEWDKALDKKSFSHKLIKKPHNVQKSQIIADFYSYNNNFELSIKWEKLNKTLKQYVQSDSATQVNWYLRFFEQTKPIAFPENMKHTQYFNEKFFSSTHHLQLFLKSTTLTNPILEKEMVIPFSLFSDFKKGNHSIIIELFATAVYKSDSSIKEIPISALTVRWKVDLEVPEIYQTTFYLKEILLQNDEKFSPKRMDFSFREGLPDIYWTIYIPAKNKKDFSNFYWRSKEATYAYDYLYSDTVYVYHYSPNDKLIIGVYDRDDFSNDDFIGNWFGSVQQLISDTFISLSFNHITSFKVKAQNVGCINCL